MAQILCRTKNVAQNPSFQTTPVLGPGSEATSRSGPFFGLGRFPRNAGFWPKKGLFLGGSPTWEAQKWVKTLVLAQIPCRTKNVAQNTGFQTAPVLGPGSEPTSRSGPFFGLGQFPENAGFGPKRGVSLPFRIGSSRPCLLPSVGPWSFSSPTYCFEGLPPLVKLGFQLAMA